MKIDVGAGGTRWFESTQAQWGLLDVLHHHEAMHEGLKVRLCWHDPLFGKPASAYFADTTDFALVSLLLMWRDCT
ncbi:hypothetical protein ALO83_103914 [Pseudomonas cannabina pv. alisalensis]|uniref:Uncharacterized protein n=1 Tax=Pseudomonas cannabina TaxID=86840 RepID=A0A0P9M1I7_PSECA|nr:Uncharacterized protein AC507_3999 [Pseudomonas syringae pv. maculicola]KPW26512.1 hypothetical protein ALO83_103914 [Pseudomonas cannabina pv. alisalensis]KPW81615.1 hypothetical protein ALO81_102357 [Pseudomonas cannabina]RMN88003.1 hypothetical protein ALQ51_102273 [Pseudomonas cannabina]